MLALFFFFSLLLFLFVPTDVGGESGFFLLCVGVCACHMCTTGLCAKMYDHDTVCLSFQERTTAVQVQLIAKSASLAGRMYNALHKKLTMTNEKKLDRSNTTLRFHG